MTKARQKIRIEFVLATRGEQFDATKLLDFIAGGCNRIGVGADEIRLRCDYDIEPGARATVSVLSPISRGMRVQLKRPRRGQPRSAGLVVGLPRAGTYTTRVYWPSVSRTDIVRISDLVPVPA